jgi:hypothetical protein
MTPQVSVSLPDWQAGEGQVRTKRAATPLALREKNAQVRGKIRVSLVLVFSLSRKTDRVADLAISH